MSSDVIHVVAAIIERHGMVLITRRRPGLKMAGYWEFPGGKIEPGETPETALERELHEELGLVTRAGVCVARNDHAGWDRHIRLIALQTHIVSGTLTLRDHDAAEWVPPTALLRYRLAPADIPIARKLAETAEEKVRGPARRSTHRTG